MSSSAFDALLTTLDVSVDALALCEVRTGVQLIGQPEDALILHYVLAGEMHLVIDDAEPIVCPTGSIVLVPSGLTQRIAADPNPDHSMIAAENLSIRREGLLLVDAADGDAGDLRFACGLVASNVPCLAALVHNKRVAVVEDMGGVAYVEHAFALMLSEMTAFEVGSRALTGALMKACLLLMIRRCLVRQADAVDAPQVHNPRFSVVLNAVLEHPAQNHTVASLATIAAMSRSSFAKEFLELFGITPMAFVAKTRLHQAATMLATTPAPVKSVAAAVGFSSRSHFSRAFRTAYGVDPSQYRKQPEP